jgi:hypothetical protein
MKKNLLLKGQFTRLVKHQAKARLKQLYEVYINSQAKALFLLQIWLEKA